MATAPGHPAEAFVMKLADGKLERVTNSNPNLADGPDGPQDVGQCSGGAQQCLPEGWGECMGSVLPDP